MSRYFNGLLKKSNVSEQLERLWEHFSGKEDIGYARVEFMDPKTDSPVSMKLADIVEIIFRYMKDKG